MFIKVISSRSSTSGDQDEHTVITKIFYLSVKNEFTWDLDCVKMRLCTTFDFIHFLKLIFLERQIYIEEKHRKIFHPLVYSCYINRCKESI